MNAKRRVFEDFAADYDRWFDHHEGVYRTQLHLLGRAVPPKGAELEIGVGSGRFTAPPGICCGIEPSFALADMAKRRGVEVATGVGEYLPYRKDSFGAVMMMTVICFLDEPRKVLQEAFRVLKPTGTVIIGFIERDGEIFSHYHAEMEKGVFAPRAVLFP